MFFLEYPAYIICILYIISSIAHDWLQPILIFKTRSRNSGSDSFIMQNFGGVNFKMNSLNTIFNHTEVAIVYLKQKFRQTRVQRRRLRRFLKNAFI